MIVDIADPNTDVELAYKAFRKYECRHGKNSQFGMDNIVDWICEIGKDDSIVARSIALKRAEMLASVWARLGWIRVDANRLGLGFIKDRGRKCE